MAKTSKMELLRVLISECLSAATDEILKIVERTIIEYEEGMSCSKWVVDSHRRLLDAAKSCSEDSLQMCVSDVKLACSQQPPHASVNVNRTGKSMPELTEDHSNTNNTNPQSFVSGDGDSDHGILVDADEDDVKQECELNMPLKILKVKKPFKCHICLSSFSSKKTMLRHMNRHPEDKSSSYQCHYCEHYFYHKSDFIIHTRIHKGSKPYKCQDCGKSFDQRDSLVIHRQKHTEKKTQCFTKMLALNIHTETNHRSVTPGTKMEEELDSRQDEVGSIKTSPLTWTPYDKSEFDQESLEPLCLYQIQTVADIDSGTVSVDHIKTEQTAAGGGASDTTGDHQLLLSVNSGEQGEAESIIGVLPRRAAGKSTGLVVQFEAGTAQKPYKCPCCSKCFSLTKTLIRHVKIHTEDKLYQCQFCGRNFCQKSDLVNHTRIHTGERPYHCQHCHKSFAQKGNLVVHMRKHTGDKCVQSFQNSHQVQNLVD
ncbi:hypothetical protein PAMA_012916 [Pampus argenteus]